MLGTKKKLPSEYVFSEMPGLPLAYKSGVVKHCSTQSSPFIKNLNLYSNNSMINDDMELFVYPA